MELVVNKGSIESSYSVLSCKITMNLYTFSTAYHNGCRNLPVELLCCIQHYCFCALRSEGTL